MSSQNYNRFKFCCHVSTYKLTLALAIYQVVFLTVKFWLSSKVYIELEGYNITVDICVIFLLTLGLCREKASLLVPYVAAYSCFVFRNAYYTIICAVSAFHPGELDIIPCEQYLSVQNVLEEQDFAKMCVNLAMFYYFSLLACTLYSCVVFRCYKHFKCLEQRDIQMTFLPSYISYGLPTPPSTPKQSSL